MEIKCKSKSIKMGCFKPSCQCSCIVSVIDSMIDDIKREMNERRNIAFNCDVPLYKSFVAFQELELLDDFACYLVDVKEQFQ